MEKLGQKKFIITLNSSVYFGVLCIPDVGGKEQGTLTCMQMDEHGFIKPWEKEWYEIQVYKDLANILISKAIDICTENGVTLMSY